MSWGVCRCYSDDQRNEREKPVDLLDSLRRKLCLPPTSQYMGGKFSRHCLALCAFVLPPLHPRLFPLLLPRRLTNGIDRGYPLLAPEIDVVTPHFRGANWKKSL